MAELIYNIKKVFNDYLDTGHLYNIPEYQRGYKWSDQQINQLLDDINGFDTGGDNDLFYCLQNITLVPEQTDKDKINIVDGQQRLTTISILLSYLGEYQIVRGKINYAVRKTSNDFLQNLLSGDISFLNEIINSNNFGEFIFNAEVKGKDYDYQDIFFMYSAMRSVAQWFYKKNTINKDLFKEKLLKNVKLIVNRVENVKEQELFMNLNAGRVQLDGSDLVRAILITRVAKQEMEEYCSAEIQDVVKLNERRIRIGWELDEINTWWSKDDIKNFFGNFTNLKTGEKETIKFDQNKHPINLLYKLWAESKGKKEIQLNFFETKSTKALELYLSIILLHRTLKDWFEDRKIYHYLGFLFAHGNIRFKEVWEKWNNKDITRNAFTEFLKSKIQITVFGKDPITEEEETGISFWINKIKDYHSDNSTNWYETSQLEKILILLDIIEISNKKENGTPLPILKPIFFKKYKEDIEHIYPGTPKELNAIKDMVKPMESIEKYISELNKGYENQNLINWSYTNEDWNNFNEEEKNKQLAALRSEIHKKRPINSIGNLVLLHLSINRGFGNNYYADKRRDVINNTENGYYVRQHTLRVFVKSAQSSDLNIWTMQDITQNANQITEIIEGFFNTKLANNSRE